MGECEGVRGVWGYMRGGMGGVTQSLAKSCRNLRVEVLTAAPVEKILVRRGSAVGVIIKGGREFKAKVVVSNADPNITFNRLIDSRELPTEFVNAVSRINYDSASVKINLALSQLPDFRACPGIRPGPSTGARSISARTCTTWSGLSPIRSLAYPAKPRSWNAPSQALSTIPWRRRVSM